MTEPKRVPFGLEHSSTLLLDDQCPSCRVVRGQLHQPGCPEEICSQCHTVLIGCSCNHLPPLDATLIIQALYRKFSDLKSALKAAENLTHDRAASPSYLVHAAMHYLFEQIDEKAREDLCRNMFRTYPLLTPTLHDENGIGYYTAEELATAFEVSVEEINGRVAALKQAGFVVKNREVEDLKKHQ